MIAPSKLQKKGAARTVVSLLEKLGVISKGSLRMKRPDAGRKNSPYMPLEI